MWPRYCKFFDQGFCGRGQTCPFIHSFEVCERLTREECAKKQCLKRHPKICKYDIVCKKRETCTFRHTTASVMYVSGGDFGKKRKSGSESTKRKRGIGAKTFTLFETLNRVWLEGGNATLQISIKAGEVQAQLAVE